VGQGVWGRAPRPSKPSASSAPPSGAIPNHDEQDSLRCKLRRGCAYLPIGTERKNLLLRSFGIIELGGKSRQIFGYKGLICKIFRNKDLRLSKSAENGFGAASRSVLGDGHTSDCPNQITIVAQGGLEVCDAWPGR
jgi:hypothetical protein